MRLGTSMVLILFPAFFTAAAYAQSNYTESLTITTYYPSPYGVYRDMEIHRSVKYKPQATLNSVTEPTEGQLVYLHNATSEGFYHYNSGGSWQAQSSGGGGVCYTVLGSNTCASGFQAVVDGYVTMYEGWAWSFAAAPNSVGGIYCSPIKHETTNGIPQGNYEAILAVSKHAKYSVVDDKICAICCK